jgi:hypothetical protein
VLDFTYLGLFNWSVRSQLAAPAVAPQTVDTLLGGTQVVNNQLVPIFVPGFSDANLQSYRNDTDLNSWELNLRVRTRPTRDRIVMQPNGQWVRYGTPSRVIEFLGGFRVLSLNDSVHYLSEGGRNAENPDQTIDGVYRVRTHNDLAGIQFGAGFTERYTEWSWGVKAKAGGFVNYMDRKSDVRTTEGGIAERSEDINDETLTVMAEAKLYAVYQLRPNLAVRTSYDALFLNGVALAPENLGLESTFPKLNIDGGPYFHGLSFGFEAFW